MRIALNKRRDWIHKDLTAHTHDDLTRVLFWPACREIQTNSNEIAVNPSNKPLASHAFGTTTESTWHSRLFCFPVVASGIEPRRMSHTLTQAASDPLKTDSFSIDLVRADDWLVEYRRNLVSRGAERVSPLRQRRATTSGTSLSTTVMRRVSSHRRARAPAAVRSDPRCPALIQQRQVVGALRLAYHVLHLLRGGILARRLRVATLQLHAHATPHVQRVGVSLLHSWGKLVDYSWKPFPMEDRRGTISE